MDVCGKPKRFQWLKTHQVAKGFEAIKQINYLVRFMGSKDIIERWKLEDKQRSIHKPVDALGNPISEALLPDGRQTLPSARGRSAKLGDYWVRGDIEDMRALCDPGGGLEVLRIIRSALKDTLKAVDATILEFERHKDAQKRGEPEWIGLWPKRTKIWKPEKVEEDPLTKRRNDLRRYNLEKRRLKEWVAGKLKVDLSDVIHDER